MLQPTALPEQDTLVGAPTTTRVRVKRIVTWSPSKLAGASVGFIFAFVVWAVGGRYTIDGLAKIANWFMAFFGIPLHINLPLSWQWYLALMILPLLASTVEWRNLPRQQIGNRVIYASYGMICVWCITAAGDLASTFLGLNLASLPLRGAISFFLTFWPEWMARSMAQIVAAEWRKR